MLVPRRKIRVPATAGIRRSRLDERVGAPGTAWFLAAPAGSGKTTVMAHVAQSWEGRCAWLSVDSTDRDPESFLASLGAALGRDHAEVHDLLAAIDADPTPLLLILDDVHELLGSEAVDLLDPIVRYRPLHCTVAMAGRHFDGIGRWRWSTSGDIDLIEADDLRFRLWEVDALFRDGTDGGLDPEALQKVTRATDGWAVALSLVRVATRRPGIDSAAVISAIGSDHRAIRAYLGEQVLGDVSEHERELLRRMSVFDFVTEQWTGALLDEDTHASVAHFARVGIMEADGPGGSGFSLHALLRSCLLAELTDEIGEGAVADLHRRAAAILEAAGQTSDAIRSFARAGAWSEVRRLASGGSGIASVSWEEIADRATAGDPWVKRAEGLHHIAKGRLRDAHSCFAAAKALFDEEAGNPRNDGELRLLGDWLEPPPGPPTSWTARLRRGLDGEEVIGWGARPADRLSRGIVEVAQGRLTAAAQTLRDPFLDPAHRALAELALALAAAMRGDDTAVRGHADSAVIASRHASLDALEAVAEGMSATVLEDADPGPLLELCRKRGDRIGEGVLELVAGLHALHGDLDPEESLTRAAEGFRLAGLVVPAVVADLLLDAGTARAPASAESEARAAGPLAHASWLVARARHDTPSAGSAAAQRHAWALAPHHGFDELLDACGASRSVPSTEHEAAIADVRCLVLGGFSVVRDGQDIDVESLRPRHRELLRLLACRAGEWVHRDRIGMWLWPDVDEERLRRAVQTAVSSIRRTIDADGEATLVERSDDSYRLRVEPTDLRTLEGRLESVGGLHGETALAELTSLVDSWPGQVVPAAGAAEWVVDIRDRLRRTVESAALPVVCELRERGDPPVAAACTVARLAEIVEDSDILWRDAIEMAVESNQPALTARLQERYRSFADTGG